MNTVFPVEFEIASGNGDKSSSGLLQGFTRDVSLGGMCIEFKTFGKSAEKRLSSPESVLRLTINPTFSLSPIRASAKIAWLKKEDAPEPPRYLIGVMYTEIDPAAQKRLIGHARRSVWAPRIVLAAVLVLACLMGALFVHDQQLINENRALIDRLAQGAEQRSQVSLELQTLDDRKKMLSAELYAAREKIKKLESSLSALTQETAEFAERKASYESQLRQSAEEQEKIAGQLEEVRAGQEKLRRTYAELEEKGMKPSSAVSEQMCRWIGSHQNLRTGLVASFEGDPLLEDIAFTYDQSLAVQAFLLFDDTASAASVLSFFDKRAATEGGAFFNAYDTVGGAPSETIVHTGPNVWLGIAALQYQHRTKDGRFLPLAKKIGDWALRLQDAEGGLPAGPRFGWYGTEHNLDAYAFFRMLHQETGDEKYLRAQQQTLEWIKKYAYSVKERRPNRGKGDSTIATDTFSWSIAAIGPAVLKETGLDPEAIMQFAEEHCEVEVSLPRKPASRVRGFDFAKARNLGRGGVISAEWTAQMIVSYQMLARYFEASGDMDKALSYAQKAGFYLGELQKLIITSPSRTGQGRGCLPYASAESVDTGHGWHTPRGASTGSVAATAYGLFAWKKYNPFELGREAADAAL